MKYSYWVAFAASAVVGVSCSSSDDLSCGPGTEAVGRLCVVAEGSGGDSSVANAGAGGEGGRSVAGSAGESDAGAPETGIAGQPDSGPVELLQRAVECGSRNITGATVVTKPITVDTTWSGVIYLPNGLILKNEPTLTIKPGTKIIVGANANVELGWQESHPRISALGTADQPIKFCGETDAAGYWGSLLVRRNVDARSVLRNVLVSDGGGGLNRNTANGGGGNRNGSGGGTGTGGANGTDAALVLETPLRVMGVQVSNSGGDGVRSVGFAEGSASLLVSGSAGVPLIATAASGANVPPDSRLTGNKLDLIEVRFDTFDSNVTLRDLGVPYRQLADVNGNKGGAHVTVTIDPGVVYQIRHQTLLDFGSATVHALGTSAAPIVFQGLPCDQDQGVCSIVPSDNGHAGGGRLNLSGGTDVRLSYVELRSMGWTKQRLIPPLDYVPLVRSRSRRTRHCESIT